MLTTTSDRGGATRVADAGGSAAAVVLARFVRARLESRVSATLRVVCLWFGCGRSRYFERRGACALVCVWWGGNGKTVFPH